MNRALDIILSHLPHGCITFADIEPGMSGDIVDGDFFYKNKMLKIRTRLGELSRLFEREAYSYYDIEEIEEQIKEKIRIYCYTELGIEDKSSRPKK